MLLTHLFENKHTTEADIASVNWNTDSKQHKLNEFAPGAGGDDEAGDDPYKYPKPKRYNRSADYFEQFEADHFDREDFDDDTGVFKGYWGSKQIAYFKFDNPARTGGNNSGMGWYYEPQSEGHSDDTTASPAVDNADERKQQELDMIRAFLKSGNRPNPDSQIGRLMKKHGMTEGTEQQLSVQQLAAISDEALDKAYGYGRSTPGNTFGWQANLKSAQFAKQMIDKGVTDIEAISDAIHKGWNVTAQAFVQNPEQFDDTAKLQAAGKLEAKLQQRAQLMKQNYAQLPDEEKEKDRVVARALLQALKGQQGVAGGAGGPQITPGMKTQYGTVDKVNGNTVTVKASNGELTTVNIKDIDQAMAEGSSENKYSNLSNRGVNRGINRAGDDFNRMMDLDQVESPHYKTQHQQDTKQRLKTKPMAGPKGVLPEQGVAEGDISQLEKDVADAPVEPIANMEAKEKVGNMDADAFDAAMARLKKLAGAGPMKTVWDPAKRVYKNVPTAVQPKK